MGKKVLVIGFLFLALTFAAVLAVGYCKPPAAHVDKNKDGVIDRKEIKMEKSEVNTPWEKRADKDKDGIVEKNEAAHWKQNADLNHNGVIDPAERNSWTRSKAKVTNPVEKKYDANGDGWLQPDEVREMLKDKHQLIKTNGKAKVNTPLEARYDANGDGIIDAHEAKVMAEDLK